jgi:hypothetical protein
LNPAQPVSTRTDWPEGVTNKVACPPSTSMKYAVKSLEAAEAEMLKQAQSSAASANRTFMVTNRIMRVNARGRVAQRSLCGLIVPAKSGASLQQAVYYFAGKLVRRSGCAVRYEFAKLRQVVGLGVSPVQDECS